MQIVYDLHGAGGQVTLASEVGYLRFAVNLALRFLRLLALRSTQPPQAQAHLYSVVLIPGFQYPNAIEEC